MRNARATVLGLLGLLLPLTAGAAGRILVPLDGPRKAARQVETALLAALTRMDKEARLASLALEDIRIAVDCTDDSIACIRQIATSLEADELIFGSVAVDQEKGFVVSIRRYEASGAPAGVIEFVLAGKPDADVDTAADAVRALMKRSGLEEAGVLEIRVEPALDDIEIVLAGQPRGSAPLRLEGLVAQRYTLVARGHGYYMWTGEVVVLPGATTVATIALERRTSAGADRDALRSLRPRTWYTAAAGALLLGAGTLFGALALADQNAIDDQPIRTRDDFVDLESRADEGERYALLASVTLVAGAAALVTATVLGVMDVRTAKRSGISATRQPGGPALAW